MDNMTDEEVKRLETMIADLKKSQAQTDLTIATINKDVADVQTALYGSQGRAGSFQRGLVSLYMDVQEITLQNRQSIAELIDLFKQQTREAELVQTAIKTESDKSFEKMKRMFTIAGGIITLITLMQLILNWLLANP